MRLLAVTVGAVMLLAGCSAQTPDAGSSYPALVQERFGDCLETLGATEIPVFEGLNGSDVKGTITVAGGEFPLVFSTGKTGGGEQIIAPADEATTAALIDEGCWTRPYGEG